jgi:hypothetical protein
VTRWSAWSALRRALAAGVAVGALAGASAGSAQAISVFVEAAYRDGDVVRVAYRLAPRPGDSCHFISRASILREDSAGYTRRVRGGLFHHDWCDGGRNWLFFTRNAGVLRSGTYYACIRATSSTPNGNSSHTSCRRFRM